jgi:hypothetical protein
MLEIIPMSIISIFILSRHRLVPGKLLSIEFNPHSESAPNSLNAVRESSVR